MMIRKRGKQSPGYLIFNCQGKFLGDFHSLKAVADFYGANINTIQGCYYHRKSYKGRCIISKDKAPKSLIALMSMCREMDRRFVVEDNNGKPVYFETKGEAKSKFPGKNVYKGREVERSFKDEFLLEAEPVNNL